MRSEIEAALAKLREQLGPLKPQLVDPSADYDTGVEIVLHLPPLFRRRDRFATLLVLQANRWIVGVDDGHPDGSFDDVDQAVDAMITRARAHLDQLATNMAAELFRADAIRRVCGCSMPREGRG